MHTELSKFGELENLSVCDNICNHLAGNVYVKFAREEEAQAALNSLRGRFYAGTYPLSSNLLIFGLNIFGYYVWD